MIYLSDIFNKTDSQILEGLIANPFVWSGETNTVLINGMGVSDTLLGEDTSSCPLPTSIVFDL